MFALGLTVGGIVGAVVMGLLVEQKVQRWKRRALLAGRAIWQMHHEATWLRAYCRQVVGVDPDSLLEPTVGHQ